VCEIYDQDHLSISVHLDQSHPGGMTDTPMNYVEIQDELTGIDLWGTSQPAY